MSCTFAAAYVGWSDCNKVEYFACNKSGNNFDAITNVKRTVE